jgi:hypothetical protein
MTQAERDSLRELQDRWLALPGPSLAVRIAGWDAPVTQSDEGKLGPTYAEVRDLLHPELRGWFADYFRGDA